MRRSRERGRQVVKHNELNDAKQIMSEVHVRAGTLFLEHRQVLPFPEAGQRETHTHAHTEHTQIDNAALNNAALC